VSLFHISFDKEYRKIGRVVNLSADWLTG